MIHCQLQVACCPTGRNGRSGDGGAVGLCLSISGAGEGEEDDLEIPVMMALSKLNPAGAHFQSNEVICKVTDVEL